MGGTQKTDIPYLHTGFEFWPTEMCQLSQDSSASNLGLATDLSVNVWFMFWVYVLFQSEFWVINLSPWSCPKELSSYKQNCLLIVQHHYEFAKLNVTTLHPETVILSGNPGYGSMAYKQIIPFISPT